MKKFYLCKLCLVVFGALLAVQNTVGKEAIGLLSCEVKKQRYMVIEDGKAEVFSTYFSNYYVEGSVLLVEYGITPENQFRFNVSWNGDDLGIGLADEIDLNFAQIKKGYENSISIRSEGFFDDIYWSTDHISIDGISGDVSLYRYYKSDWDGYLVQRFKSFVHTALLDCRHKADKVEEVFQLLRQK